MGSLHFGYGAISKGSKPNVITKKAHRALWEYLNEREIPEKKVIMHTCDNRACMNPKHHKLGTQRENMMDAFIKGRMIGVSQPGERNSSAKLTLAKVRNIRKQFWKIDGVRLSKFYGVTSGAIYRIWNGQSWNQ